jgi:phage shock protein A
VNQAITQMDQVTQQNAALVEQAAAAAEAMQDQAAGLAGLVGTFRTGDEGRKAAAKLEHAARPVSSSRSVAPVRAARPAPRAKTRVEPMAAGDEWETF